MATVNVSIMDLPITGLIKYIEKLTKALDKLDTEDFFGTEGWKHYLNMEEV